jgi:CTP:molybdopterin cytidylyltransferase MocA
MKSPIHAVVLAAGKGTRLGYPKAALVVQDQWMLPILMKALRLGGATRITLVLSKESQQAIQNLGETGADALILNPSPEDGRMSSVFLGIQSTQSEEALLIHPCDIPLLSPDVLLKMRRAWQREPNPQELFVRPVTSAGRGGHPLLIGADLVPKLQALPAGQNLRDFMRQHSERILNVTIPRDPGPFLDVNTPEQLQLLETLLHPDSCSPS